MSVYQKFIESSESLTSPESSLAAPKPHAHYKLTSSLKQSNKLQKKVISQIKSINKSSTMVQIQQQATNLIPMINPSPNSNSNPLNSSRNQYKRLINVNYQQQQAYQNTSCGSGKPTILKRQSQNFARMNPFQELLRSIDDPALLRWLQDIRFEPELEPLAFQSRTCAYDEYSQAALSVRYSQVSIQEMRLESNFILDFIDYLIGLLPLVSKDLACLNKYHIEFSELWTRLVKETSAKTISQQQAYTSNQVTQSQNPLTITFTTPKQSQAFMRTMKPLDKLAVQIRNLCMQYANQLFFYQENLSNHNSITIDNGALEADLRKLKELFGKFVEISIKAECRNIVQALNFDFNQFNLNRCSSNSSLKPVRPFESALPQLPLKWALIALWQLTKDDSYICRTLTEKWNEGSKIVSRRLDYSTKYDRMQTSENIENDCRPSEKMGASISHSDYQKLYQLCQQRHFPGQQQQAASGALSNALKSKQLADSSAQTIKQISTIELLIDIIISQPNKHERLDMMNYLHSAEACDEGKLIDLNESISAAIYTSNQYKVAALRILNHLCCNEQAIKTILKCFSTPPPAPGYPQPENKIIRSIFECYQTAQEHIYQNETMFHKLSSAANQRRGRKRARFQLDEQQQQMDEYSDYGSRQTGGSIKSDLNSLDNFKLRQDREAHGNQEDEGEDDEGDDAVVKEAIRLIVQLTAPFHRTNQGLDYYTLIGRFSIECLVKYLTNIISKSAQIKNREMIFLSLTALANISFITTEPMKTYGTNRCILEMFKSSKLKSKDLELRDQAVTILANTADKNLNDIINNGGITFLLSCLESCPIKMSNYEPRVYDETRSREEEMIYSNYEVMRRIENKPARDRKPIDFSEADFKDLLDCSCDDFRSNCLNRLSDVELAALERIHQKTAVAFARMAQDSSTINLILKYGGIKQMIDLCKFSYKRNFSDTVLIACIAALRKMAKVINLKVFKDYNALDLIELELQQALEIYGHSSSSARENYRQLLCSSEV